MHVQYTLLHQWGRLVAKGSRFIGLGRPGAREVATWVHRVLGVVLTYVLRRRRI